MTSTERTRIIQEVQGTVDRIANDRQQLEERRTRLGQTLARLRGQIDNLRELRNNLAHTRFQSISSTASLTDLIQQVPSYKVDFQKRLSKLEQDVAAFNGMIAGLEREKAEYLAVMMRLQDKGYTSPEEASESLVRLETRSLALRAAAQAAQTTLTAQRNADMPAIYAQVAKVWQTFLGKDNWRVELDEDGMPVLYDGEGRRFDLSQFSGGEKTALLIMLHTIIAHHFSKSDFLLIDEPLEHLDPINRRSLVNFLVSAFRRGGFRQAIIATFEETLIRKYMSDEGVNIIHL